VATVTSLENILDDRAEQVERLRRKIAEMSGGARVSRREMAPPVRPSSVVKDLLEWSDLRSDQLPASLPRGTVAVLSGARSLTLRLVAEVTAAGGYAAIVGQPDVGLLAAAQMGADLERLAVIPDPGPDPVEVAAVLMDGLDLVALGLGGRKVTAGRVRAVTARARQHECTLLVTGGDWPGAAARLEARVCGYEVVGAGAGDPMPGCGRIGQVRLATRVRGRLARPMQAVGG
jgi:hypothetical protein